MKKTMLSIAIVAMAAMVMSGCSKSKPAQDNGNEATDTLSVDGVEEFFDESYIDGEPDLLTGIAFYENVTVSLYEVEGSFTGTIMGDESGAEWDIDGYHFDIDDVRWTILRDGEAVGSMQLARSEYGFTGLMTFEDGETCPVNITY